MSDRRAPVPGTGLVIGVLAAALVSTAVLRSGRVTIPTASTARESRPWPDMRLDVNSATDVELNALPGIGPRLAERVAADRQANGAFESIEDLQRVQGIGPRLVERMRPFVICEP